MIERRLPVQSLRALVAQMLGLAAAGSIFWLLPALMHGHWRFSIVQGLAAAGFSRALRQPPWWIPIHLLFVPAVLGALTLQLPSGFYLAAFAVCALIFWGTIKGDVPLFLSSPAVADAVAEIARREHAQRFVDLGAGVGSVAVPLAQRFPQLLVEAWERAPLPWAVTVWRARSLKNMVVLRGSFWDCDLSVYDLVFAFLSPAPMPELGEKIRREMPAGSLFVSSSFPLPGWQPESVREIDDRRRTMLYCYRIGEKT